MEKNTDSTETLVIMLLSGQLVNYSLLSGKGKRFLFFNLSELALEPTQPNAECVLWGSFLKNEWPGQKVGQSSPSSINAKKT